ncbi:aspartate aminotransferase family protein [Clostridium grantii]|uniref:Acetylornithine aminotransferase n=1 Tax=Clostridium grantii DSM 8605 TaxID=1121316 RepID=A0A1M5XR75_9CLOT|nr:aspartate aminotransferase family protein [Clostridium grantii]SHI01763.1 acetylornithine/N-succinyldiaminopimelate aminotransferase [Clostridium grantii DSM 8605]
MTENYVMETYGRFDVTFEKGEGTKLYDSENRVFLDFVSGIAVNCLGHSHPSIVKAIQEQSQKLLHVSNYYWTNSQIELAKILCENSVFNKAFFCNSGTEAVEAALKLSKKYSVSKGYENKNTIIYMNNSFHGRSMGALSVTGQPKYQETFKPLMPNTISIDFNDSIALEEVFNENICAIILEPIQGEGGVVSANREFLKKAKDLCEKYDALLIFDEVQCGIGRTGSLFAYEKFGISPDVVCLAKALGGGIPIGAMLANEKASVLQPGDHGTTFGGNPLSCAVACTVLKELIYNGVIASVDEKSTYLTNKLLALKEKYPVIVDVRGLGLLIGIELNLEPKAIMKECFSNGLLVVSAGKNVLRFLPPLNVNYEELDEAVSLFEKALINLS